MLESHQLHQQKLQQILYSLQPIFESGISEFDLIMLLKQAPHQIFAGVDLQDSLILFQTHFMLFHSLYNLRTLWRNNKTGELNILSTQIKLHPSVDTTASATNKTPQTLDPLAQYYQDWQHFSKTDHDEVNEMLDRFWTTMLIDNNRSLPTVDRLIYALESLEMNEFIDTQKRTISLNNHDTELSISKVKLQYRKLQHQHHPDKGGNHEKAQNLQDAYTLLCRYLR